MIFLALLLLQRKYHSWYIRSPIRDMIRVILTPTLHSGSVASRILIASINSSFIKCLLSIYQYGCQLKTKSMSSALLTFSNPSLPIPYKRGRHNRISLVDNGWIRSLENLFRQFWYSHPCPFEKPCSISFLLEISFTPMASNNFNMQITLKSIL